MSNGERSWPPSTLFRSSRSKDPGRKRMKRWARSRSSGFDLRRRLRAGSSSIPNRGPDSIGPRRSLPRSPVAWVFPTLSWNWRNSRGNAAPSAGPFPSAAERCSMATKRSPGRSPTTRKSGSDNPRIHSRNIFRTIENLFLTRAGAVTAKRRFAEYVVLDALIGNTDRHHENWGFLRKRTPAGHRGFLAPSFDHASSLGRELRDEKRQRLLAEGMIGRYCERGRGAIYWADTGRRGPSPLDLLRRAAREYPDLFRFPVARVSERGKTLADAVLRAPEDWMSKVARRFSLELLRYNASEIQKCMP